METIAISLVPAYAFVPSGQLSSFDFNKFLDDTCRILIGTGVIRTAFIGLDISFNDLSARGFPNGWQIQAYIIGETTDRGKLASALNTAFQKTETVPHPVYIRSFDGTASAASYALKFQFVRRVSYVDTNGHWNTKKRRLQASEHIELMLVLSQLGLGGRMAVIGSDIPKFDGSSAM